MNPTINPVVIDTSNYQNVTDWDKVVAAGIWGVINKATEGVTVADATFNIRRKPVTSRGLLYGAYHFMRPDSILAQVDFFLKTVGDTSDLLIALDHEDERVSIDLAKEWLQLMFEKTGQRPVFYDCYVSKAQCQARDTFLAQHRCWLAEYGNKPVCSPSFDKPWLWQFTGDGEGPLPHSIPGVQGDKLDINSFTGSRDDLKAQWLG